MNDNNYRQAQKYLSLAILVTKLATAIWQLLSMAFNYRPHCPRYATK